MEGTVDVELADGTVIAVVAPATLDVTAGVASGPLPLPWDGLFGDPWLVANTDRDVDAGFADRATVYQSYGAGVRVDGRHLRRHDGRQRPRVRRVVRTYSRGGDRPVVHRGVLHAVCGWKLRRGRSGGHPRTRSTASPTRSTAPPPNNFCWMDDDADGVYDEGEEILSPEWTTASDVFVAPSAAEVRDGDYLVTDFVWHRVTVSNPEGIPCARARGHVQGRHRHR